MALPERLQSVGEPAPKLSPCSSSNRATKPFNGRKRWADDAARAQFFENSGD